MSELMEPIEQQNARLAKGLEESYGENQALKEAVTALETELVEMRCLAAAMLRIRCCRECGCTDTQPCEEGCWWLTDDLCSACAEKRGLDLREEPPRAAVVKPERPTVVCLCGSTRFYEAFQQQNYWETLAGRIVLTVGCDTKADDDLFANKTDAEKQEIKTRLDELHKRKIDLADEILVLNVGGYIGDSTRSEIEYATALGKNIRWLEPPTA